jgi:hypothetical protein
MLAIGRALMGAACDARQHSWAGAAARSEIFHRITRLAQGRHHILLSTETRAALGIADAATSWKPGASCSVGRAGPAAQPQVQRALPRSLMLKETPA